MTKPKIGIVVAITSKNAAIGNGAKLLHAIPDDLKRFKEITLGHPIIMGRKTFESIGRALPKRANIVVTRNREFAAPDGVYVAYSIEEAIALAARLEIQDIDCREIFIIGGGELYAQALSLTDILYLTIVESDAEGDVFFPPNYTSHLPRISFREKRTDEKSGLEYEWINFERL